MNSIPTSIVAILITTLLSLPSRANDTGGREPSKRNVLVRLHALADRIEELDERISRLERRLVKRPTRVDRNGIIRDDKGRAVGVWGIDAQPDSGTIVPRR